MIGTIALAVLGAVLVSDENDVVARAVGSACIGAVLSSLLSAGSKDAPAQA